MTSALLAELIPETEALLDDILDEIEDPHVQRRGIMYLEPMEATVGTKATIEAEVIRADEESS